MTYEHLQALVQTAGNTKILSLLCGQELIVYPIQLLTQLHIPTTVLVDADTQQKLRSLLTHHVGDTLTYATQGNQQDSWYQEHIVVISGAMPLLTSEIIQELYLQHLQTEAAITHVNSADIYIVQRTVLELHALQENNSAHTCSYTSLLKFAQNNGFKITAVSVLSDQIHNVTTLHDLAAAQQIKRTEIINHWMDNGVYIASPSTTHVDVTATIGTGSSIGAGVHIKGATHIGTNCTIDPYAIIDNSIIGDNVTVLAHSVISNSHLDPHVQVGPFAHIKEQSHLQEQTIIGNFVEVKKTTIGKNSKAKHLSYLGNADIGSHVNIGAGTITCNHNGVSKQKTTIKDNAYIGVNNTLIAPVTIGEGAYTAGGSVITHDVPDHALAIGRARQVIKEGYAHKLRGTKQEVPTQEVTNIKPAIKTNNTTSENT